MTESLWFDSCSRPGDQLEDLFRVPVDGGNGRVASDRLGDEVSDESVVELRGKLVFRLSDILAAEDNGENTRPGADLGRDAVREWWRVRRLEPWLKP